MSLCKQHRIRLPAETRQWELHFVTLIFFFLFPPQSGSESEEGLQTSLLLRADLSFPRKQLV